MAEDRSPGRNRTLDAGFWLVALLAVACGVLVLASLVRGEPGSPSWTGGPPNANATSAPGPGSPAADVSAFLVDEPVPAPPIALENAATEPVTLASLRGSNVLVFFGYTHCPDVCPATIGIIGETMRAFGPGVRALFVTIDPERDTPQWLGEYGQYLPAGLTVLTGTPTEIRATADAWGVKYARVDSTTPDAYSMSHTADVWLVDASGFLRADFPFGTQADAMTAALRSVAASPLTAAASTGPGGLPGPAAASSAQSSGPPGQGSAPPPASSPGAPASADASGLVSSLRVDVVSSSVWAGGASPVILALTGPAGRLEDAATTVTVQLTTTAGGLAGSPSTAVAVRPPGEERTFYVATLDIPSPGWWRLEVRATTASAVLSGNAAIASLDAGSTAQLGAPAPAAHTPTLDDVGGDPRAVTTDPAPDLRLSRTSTTDALAAHAPFVLVIDSTRFRVTSACGKAIVMARYLLDRWPGVDFIHLEPYRYSVVTDTPVLDGSLADPPLTDPSAAWGIGGSPWGATSMPWVFVVDGRGVVRAKYQGVMGSDDVDVMLSLIAAGG